MIFFYWQKTLGNNILNVVPKDKFSTVWVKKVIEFIVVINTVTLVSQLIIQKEKVIISSLKFLYYNNLRNNNLTFYTTTNLDIQ